MAQVLPWLVQGPEFNARYQKEKKKKITSTFIAIRHFTGFTDLATVAQPHVKATKDNKWLDDSLPQGSCVDAYLTG